ncbi:MAG: type IV secretory system conjugative DNA transfer family protein [Spiroplasma sp.]|nr:type IV secretory system conjugative DNA transfer family protein [Spiroplasma sp.]
MKEKKYKWKILFGLFIIPITFILLITIIGMIIAYTKDKKFIFDLINYWKIAFSSFYYWLLALLLTVIGYSYLIYHLYFTERFEAKLKATKHKDYGNANWLLKKDINKLYPLVTSNNIASQHGFVVNSKKTNHVMSYNLRTNTHSLIIGGTGSGKTQGLVLPTININGKSKTKPSMIMTDVKGELYQIQGKFLQDQGYNVKVLNLRNIKGSIAWNPLKMIYDQFKLLLLNVDEQEKLHLRVLIQSDIQDLTKTLFVNKNQTDPFWNDSGALITEAIILGILEKTEILIKQDLRTNNETTEELLQKYLPATKFNLASVTVIISLGKDMIEWFNSLPETSIAKLTANQVLQSGSKTLASILMVMSTTLAIFKNNFIRNLTCRNDLEFNEIIDKPTALFIVIPDENQNYYIFVTLLISQLYKFLVIAANRTSASKLARPVYFLCDEFGNVPAIPNIETMITISRSRNIFFQLILQDIQQLKEKYGNEKANIIYTNCSLHIFLQTMDLETAERYSKMIGERTVVEVSTSSKAVNKINGKIVNPSRISDKDDSRSHSQSLRGHTLISTSDLMKLPNGQAIIFYAKENPFKAALVPWHKINPKNPAIINLNNELKLINFEQDFYYDIKKYS